VEDGSETILLRDEGGFGRKEVGSERGVGREGQSGLGVEGGRSGLKGREDKWLSKGQRVEDLGEERGDEASGGKDAKGDGEDR
jgi:hypothetical protein